MNRTGVAGWRERCVRRVHTIEVLLTLGLALLAGPSYASTYQIIVNFTGSDLLSNPGGILLNENGTLYGTTTGQIFELAPPSAGNNQWTVTTLGVSGGFSPGLVADANGVLYGQAAPTLLSSVQDLFSFTPPAEAGGQWTLATLHTFGQEPGDGKEPVGKLALAKNGVLFGATQMGGNLGRGTLYASDTSGTIYQILHDFSGSPDGATPNGSLVFNQGGLYGTTEYGGDSTTCGQFGCGTVFQLTPPATPDGPWNETVIYSFTGGSDGEYPLIGLVRDQNGILYGSTSAEGGGTGCLGLQGCGSVFSLTPPVTPGGNWTKTSLATFNGTDGGTPLPNLVIGSGGTVYGVTNGVGTSYPGMVFSLTPPTAGGGTWTKTVMHTFIGTNDGSDPRTGLTIVGGWLVGTTAFSPQDSICGFFPCTGTVYAIEP